ncbi:Site-specific recombinase XerD [Persephonella hydrogeniphila]|uniref:Site-specific recombinase XerD n=1 Tax=Persephonella hydrogeniphila TaxID=198703 RepID=A0A285NK48_9AQUI|nr:tyrosine-type recombinase/integrase [Persephonella hydrogeniphila]SNZ09894.1 Site-specific recombinase XerD [Persephonella hydrogeniphila]
MPIVFLSKNGYFLLDKIKGKKYIKNFYRYSTGEKFFYIEASKINLEKIKNYIEDREIDKKCYLYQLQNKLNNSDLQSNTKKTYFSINLRFLETINKTPDTVKKEDIERFLSILKRRGKSTSTLSVSYSALKYFYSSVLGKIDFREITRPYPEIPITSSLSREELKKIISSIKNEKHKLLIEVAYGCGLKLHEVIKITKNDIDFHNKIFVIKTNHSYRKVPIPSSLIKKLQSYSKKIKSEFLFFSERNPEKHITPRAAEDIFKKSLKKAGIKRDLSFKSLRDSFVAHLIDRNVNPELIRKVIGIKKAQFKNKYGFYLNFTEHIPDLLIFR